MKGTVIHVPYDVRFEERDTPRIEEPTDAILRIVATCVCGSDLWTYRGLNPIERPIPMGHEYVGVVEEVGPAVERIRPGQFVVGSFFATDGTCPLCQAGYPSSCVNRRSIPGAQAPYVRIPWADGTLVPTPGVPDRELIPSLLTLSDVMGTGWFAADAAEVRPGKTAVVVGDGAVGLCAVIAAKQMGASRIIIMSRHEKRQALAKEFGATDIVEERGEEGAKRVLEMTDGLGAESVLECVGTQESMSQAIQCTRPGGHMSFVGVPHGVSLDGRTLFYKQIHLHGGPAPVRKYLPDLIQLVWEKKIQPGKVFDLELPLDQVAEGYRAMHERRAIKALLWPET
ncbi:zinc-dependent alcohol dehydrogenase family protein [Alicyclobacillus sendaiensis]|uniref:zinc-dependent alcohol dehydrogenase family protein n=1 Tax=Alicyclobacillus sendaiensis TaxID=192387 RepID=UPI000783565A|nr:zinc-dependent alcohol dehydrogenase family protein [Alicyclobacillus sendaiensis]